MGLNRQRSHILDPIAAAGGTGAAAGPRWAGCELSADMSRTLQPSPGTGGTFMKARAAGYLHTVAMLSSSVDDVAARLRHDVEHLASLDRRTTSPGERSSADWIAGRLRDIGAADVTSCRFRSQSSWAPTNLAHVVLAMAAGAMPGIIGRLLAAAVAASYELDVSGRSHWLRRLLPAKTGVSVTGCIPLPGGAKPDKTLVLVAHHDAAHNGIVWHRRTVALNRLLSRRTGETMPTHAPALVAMAANMAPMWPVRVAAQFILGGILLAAIQSMRSYTTPGANDNATGVATVLEVANRLRSQQQSSMEVLLVFPGGEEAGNTGMRAWASQYARHLDTTPWSSVLTRWAVVGISSWPAAKGSQARWTRAMCSSLPALRPQPQSR